MKLEAVCSALVALASLASAQRGVVRVRGRARNIGGVAPVAAPLPVAAAAPGCPEPFGLQVYEDPLSCNHYFKCANGTLSYEQCENGLLFEPATALAGAVHNHCSYNWAAQCVGEDKALDDTAITTSGCLYQFGIYPSAACSPSYIKCAYGVPQEHPCDVGTVYDDRIHACNWPDQISDVCDPSALLGGFQCPHPDDLTPLARRFFPFPRFGVQGQPDLYIICVNDLPRLQACTPGHLFDSSTLGCVPVAK